MGWVRDELSARTARSTVIRDPAQNQRAAAAMNNLMIDLETMGVRNNSVIVALGACFFDMVGVGTKFYAAVSRESCRESGLIEDESTIRWWSVQSKEARAAWDVESPLSLFDALSSFAAFVRQECKEELCVPWGNGSDFDIVILKSAYHALGADPPFKYHNHRCFRTARALLCRNVDVERKGTHHNALDDAVYQAEVLIEGLKQHKLVL